LKESKSDEENEDMGLLEGNCFREKENELTKAGAVV
jgi:hypothetical protein